MEKIKNNRSFLFTALGAAMGLGNALRFPGLCALHGGGAFIFSYAVALFAVCLPLLRAELSLGKRCLAPFPQSLKALAPRAEAVGWAACANSAFVAVVYSAVVCWLIVGTVAIVPFCTSASPTLIASGADIPQATPFLIAAVWAALYLLLRGGARALSKAAKVTVTVQITLFSLLAARGLLYENSSAALYALFCPDFSALASFRLWADAFGQALLSLSLAAGVMPAFGRLIPDGCSPAACARKIVVANFAGCILSSVALFTAVYGCGLQSRVTSSGMITAFSVYPAAIANLFPSSVACGIFGAVFFFSLTLTALQSALSLLSALLPPLSFRLRFSARRTAGLVCLAGFFLSQVFASSSGAAAVEVGDRFANGFNALVVAAAQCAVFSRFLFRRGVFFRDDGRSAFFSLSVRLFCPVAFAVLALYGVGSFLFCGRVFPELPLRTELVFGWLASAAVLGFYFIVKLIGLLTERLRRDKIKAWKTSKKS